MFWLNRPTVPLPLPFEGNPDLSAIRPLCVQQDQILLGRFVPGCVRRRRGTLPGLDCPFLRLIAARNEVTPQAILLEQLSELRFRMTRHGSLRRNASVWFDLWGRWCFGAEAKPPAREQTTPQGGFAFAWPLWVPRHNLRGRPASNLVSSC